MTEQVDFLGKNAYVRKYGPTYNYAMFAKVIGNLGSVESVSGHTFYDNIRVESDRVYFTRRSTGNEESVSLDELFDFYEKCDRFTTTAAKSYISGRAQSPATAIVIAALKNEEKDQDGIRESKRKRTYNKRMFWKKVDNLDGCQIGCGFVILMAIIIYIVGSIGGNDKQEDRECEAVLTMGWGAYEKVYAEKILEFMNNQDSYGLVSYEMEGYIVSFRKGERFKFVRMEKGGFYVVSSDKYTRPLYVPSAFLETVKPEKKANKSKKKADEEVQISEGLKKILEETNIVKDEYIPKDGMRKAIVETGKKFSPLFEESIGKPVGRQEILDREPLATYLVTYLGADLWRKMKLCRQSEEGIVKEVSLSGSGFKYYYDCYQDRPDGNYFALVLDENQEFFCIELQFDGDVYFYMSEYDIGAR